MRITDTNRQPLIVATRNQGKVAELRILLARVPGLELSSLEGHNVPDVVEDGTTFEENAIKKARVTSMATGLPALADDSGLEVDALRGAPGVYSARYAGPNASDADNNAKLLLALRDVPEEKRTARFRSVVVLADTGGALGDRVLTAEGVCEGIILTAARGSGGFGYDPLFFVPALGATFAEIGIGPKNEQSHRARAFSALLPDLSAYFRLANQNQTA